MTARMVMPPLLDTEDGRPRRIGVEIEFAGLPCRQAAELVRELFGGRIEAVDPYRFQVIDTGLGEFTVELDFQYLHVNDPTAEPAEPSGWDDLGRTVRNGMTNALAAVTGLWVPVEVVCPPIPLPLLPELDRLVPALRGRGAQGSSDGLLYAFATQLNPEAPSLRARSIVAHLKAYMLLAESLRTTIDMDLLRRALPFADRFPKPYVLEVVDPDYWPELPQLVHDYLEANATRNRELDLLPLLSHLAPDAVRAKVDSVLVKSRPTFHYRLPDTRLADPAWSAIVEWNRWVEVEWLADDPVALGSLGSACLDVVRSEKSCALAEAVDTWRAERSRAR